MGLLSKLFGGKKQVVVTEIGPIECPHSVLVARWDSVQDMGIEEKATRFMCETCKEIFSPQDAFRLRDTLAERLAAADVIIEAPGSDGAGAS
jgi:hypothetical protein